MSDILKHTIINFLKPMVTDLGFASVDRFAAAPEAHHPERVCRDAQTVIVLALTFPAEYSNRRIIIFMLCIEVITAPICALMKQLSPFAIISNLSGSMLPSLSRVTPRWSFISLNRGAFCR